MLNSGRARWWATFVADDRVRVNLPFHVAKHNLESRSRFSRRASGCIWDPYARSVTGRLLNARQIRRGEYPREVLRGGVHEGSTLYRSGREWDGMG